MIIRLRERIVAGRVPPCGFESGIAVLHERLGEHAQVDHVEAH